MADYNKYTDDELLALLQGGNEPAFDEIYRRYWPVLLRHAYRMLQDKEACRDVLQDVFVIFWKKAAQLDVKVTLSAYLYSMVRNGVLKVLARDQVRLKYLGQVQSEESNARDFTGETVLEYELQRHINHIVDNMPERMREVYILSKDKLLSHQEISRRLNISTTTVKYHLQGAMKRLKEAVGF